MADQTFNLNRKLTTGFTVLKTSDNGVTWTKPSFTVDSVNNTVTFDIDLTTDVAQFHYEALSDFTEPDDNTAVYGELGDVYFTYSSRITRGNRLESSLISQIGKEARGAYSESGSTRLQDYILDYGDTQKLYNWSGDKLLNHNALNSLLAPLNASTAVKALYHLIEKDGLLYLQYHGRELQHDGTDWGDDNTIPIVDDESTMTDDNGTTVKTFTHTELYPIGIADYTETN